MDAPAVRPIELKPENEIDVYDEMREIINLHSTHFTKPSFDGEEIEFTMGEKLILEDKNNIFAAGSALITFTQNFVF